MCAMEGPACTMQLTMAILLALRNSKKKNNRIDCKGFARFVNIRDGRCVTPLHLAARQRRPECVHVLLYSGALVYASTGIYSCPGSTPLHIAAKGVLGFYHRVIVSESQGSAIWQCQMKAKETCQQRDIKKQKKQVKSWHILKQFY